jgi:hypothetical protein
MASRPEEYLRSSSKIQQLIKLTLAIQKCIPKKYSNHLTALFKRHPEVIDHHELTLTIAELGDIWQCPTTESVARRLHLMTHKSQGAMTYEVREESPGPNNLVLLTFSVPANVEGALQNGR